ncbi:MAG: hypothetical protein JSV34_06890, partial [Candidatus Omnitrophota bacterium]
QLLKFSDTEVVLLVREANGDWKLVKMKKEDFLAAWDGGLEGSLSTISLYCNNREKEEEEDSERRRSTLYPQPQGLPLIKVSVPSARVLSPKGLREDEEAESIIKTVLFQMLIFICKVELTLLGIGGAEDFAFFKHLFGIDISPWAASRDVAAPKIGKGDIVYNPWTMRTAQVIGVTEDGKHFILAEPTVQSQEDKNSDIVLAGEISLLPVRYEDWKLTYYGWSQSGGVGMYILDDNKGGFGETVSFERETVAVDEATNSLDYLFALRNKIQESLDNDQLQPGQKHYLSNLLINVNNLLVDRFSTIEDNTGLSLESGPQDIIRTKRAISDKYMQYISRLGVGNKVTTNPYDEDELLYKVVSGYDPDAKLSEANEQLDMINELLLAKAYLDEEGEPEIDERLGAIRAKTFSDNTKTGLSVNSSFAEIDERRTEISAQRDGHIGRIMHLPDEPQTTNLHKLYTTGIVANTVASAQYKERLKAIDELKNIKQQVGYRDYEPIIDTAFEFWGAGPDGDTYYTTRARLSSNGVLEYGYGNEIKKSTAQEVIDNRFLYAESERNHRVIGNYIGYLDARSKPYLASQQEKLTQSLLNLLPLSVSKDYKQQLQTISEFSHCLRDLVCLDLDKQDKNSISFERFLLIHKLDG